MLFAEVVVLLFLLQSVRRSGVRDPVLLLDEVDKMGHDSLRGDPAAALLEVLDPNQNHAFVDTYLSVAFDLSQVSLIRKCPKIGFPLHLQSVPAHDALTDTCTRPVTNLLLWLMLGLAAFQSVSLCEH